MTAVPVKQRMTADEFLARPFGEGPRWQELVEGEIAIGIRSPSTWRYDVGAKKASYERHGLPELWLVDTPAAEVLVFRRSRPATEAFDKALELSDGDVLGSLLLPRFALALAELFHTE